MVIINANFVVRPFQMLYIMFQDSWRSSLGGDFLNKNAIYFMTAWKLKTGTTEFRWIAVTPDACVSLRMRLEVSYFQNKTLRFCCIKRHLKANTMCSNQCVLADWSLFTLSCTSNLNMDVVPKYLCNHRFHPQNTKFNVMVNGKVKPSNSCLICCHSVVKHG